MLRGILMGSPGSGKGTRLCKALPLKIISTGDLLRDHIKRRSQLGLAAAQTIQSGNLVSDTLVMEIVKDQLSKIHGNPWILDGFPRTVNQATMLNNLLEKINQPLDMVLNLDVPFEIILKRIQDRWIHAPSGRVYNLSYNPPKKPGLDDVTGEPLEKRPDDDEIIVKNRLEKYKEMTLPLLKFYKQQGILHNFQGESSDEIYPKLKHVIDQHFKKN